MSHTTTTHAAAPDTESGAETALALDNQLCFALYATSRLVTAAYRPFLDEMGLTYPQYLVLLALWEQPGSSMKQLCARLSLNYGTVSPLVKRLVTAGLVESDPAGADKRAVVLRPSAASWDLQSRAECMIETVTNDVGVTPEQLAGIRDAVNDLGRRLAESVRIRGGARDTSPNGTF